MNFPKFIQETEWTPTDGQPLPSIQYIVNRWNEIVFEKYENIYENRIEFRARVQHKGSALSYQKAISTEYLIYTEYVEDLIDRVWTTVARGLAEYLRDTVGEPWFADNWDRFDVRYLKDIQIAPLSAPRVESFESKANNFAKAIPNIYRKAPCPYPECPRERTIYEMIIHLNDAHMWHRGDIADWVESLPYDLTLKG